ITSRRNSSGYAFTMAHILPAGANAPTRQESTKPAAVPDDHGRRTDTWLNATPNGEEDPTVWKAHQKLEYDASGKVTRVLGSRDSSNPSSVVDTKYCYVAGTAAGGSCDPDKGNDRDQLQWSKDMTGQITEYDYKASDGKSSTRLQKVKQTGGAQNTTWTFTYDKAGDRTGAKAVDTDTKRVISDTQLSFNAVGQITTAGYQYDGTGNLIAAPGKTFTYNGAQQMTSSTKDGIKSSYTYAGASMVTLLSQSTAGSKAYQYTYGRSGALTARTVVSEGTASVLSDPSSGRPLDLRTADGSTSMWVIDGIGNPAAAITDKGEKAYVVSYSPYGGETVTYGDNSSQWQQNPYGFKGGLRSSGTNIGLTKFGYRWQSAETGGWISRDTLDAPLDPNNANRYAYAGDDPINASDPSGRAYVGGVGELCAFVCLQVGGGYDGDWDFTIGAAVGPDVGVNGSVGGGAGTNEGPSVNASCSADLGVGVYGEVGVGEGGDLSGGGGVGGGAGGGCNVGVSYTF
ncbi:RHS repeat-associated core domain-containing protein, partial [Curtobacterium sp. MCBD17_021]|uniref:RHS repeat-associated core domain-containing protein n=1 Tax=Curtobacterium sp. MCBD17_021 TaxID=2175665 RepID=UPI000DB77067